MFGVAVCGGVLLLLWMICKLKAQTRRDRMVVTRRLLLWSMVPLPIYDYQCLSNKSLTAQLLHPTRLVSLHGIE